MNVALARVRTLLPLVAVLMLPVSSPACGQVEVEADPIAYILSGYSGHLAYASRPVRASLGVFGVDQPEFFHGNEGWEAESRGVTAKLDYFLRGLGGLFVGADAGQQWNEYTLESASEVEGRNEFRAGVRTGYRFGFGGTGFYVVPWVSVRYLFNPEEIAIGDEAFERGRISVFPTVHLGWQF